MMITLAYLDKIYAGMAGICRRGSWHSRVSFHDRLHCHLNR